jgi:hypothetical protein
MHSMPLASMPPRKQPSLYTFQTVVLTTQICEDGSYRRFPARTIFDTGSELELVSHAFVERNGLSELVTLSNSAQVMTGVGGLKTIAKEMIKLTWFFQGGSTPRELTCYLIDIPEEDFDILLGSSFLHHHKLLVVDDPSLTRRMKPVAKVRTTYQGQFEDKLTEQQMGNRQKRTKEAQILSNNVLKKSKKPALKPVGLPPSYASATAPPEESKVVHHDHSQSPLPVSNTEPSGILTSHNIPSGGMFVSHDVLNPSKASPEEHGPGATATSALTAVVQRSSSARSVGSRSSRRSGHQKATATNQTPISLSADAGISASETQADVPDVIGLKDHSNKSPVSNNKDQAIEHKLPRSDDHLISPPNVVQDVDVSEGEISSPTSELLKKISIRSLSAWIAHGERFGYKKTGELHGHLSHGTTDHLNGPIPKKSSTKSLRHKALENSGHQRPRSRPHSIHKDKVVSDVWYFEVAPNPGSPLTHSFYPENDPPRDQEPNEQQGSHILPSEVAIETVQEVVPAIESSIVLMTDAPLKPEVGHEHHPPSNAHVAERVETLLTPPTPAWTDNSTLYEKSPNVSSQSPELSQAKVLNVVAEEKRNKTSTHVQNGGLNITMHDHALSNKWNDLLKKYSGVAKFTVSNRNRSPYSDSSLNLTSYV